MRFGYPLMLDVTNRPVVIVGGGAVAVRKVRGLHDAGAADITVVALDCHADLPADVKRVAERYEARHLSGAALVFAATDRREVNDAVVRDCRERRILVQRADNDEQEPGDFSTPAALRQGAVTVTVSAGSPALAAAIRDGLADRWDARWTKMAEAMQALRPRIVEDPALPPAQRSAILRALATEEALGVLDREGPQGLTSWIEKRINLSDAGESPQ
jgi:precorrin-2 dehydrogenase/sirohydrochlorin ferrochelatase